MAPGGWRGAQERDVAVLSYGFCKIPSADSRTRHLIVDRVECEDEDPRYPAVTSQIPHRADSTRRVLIVTEDALREEMAGPSIRAWQIAQALSDENAVKLVSTTTCERSSERFATEKADSSRIAELEGWCDVAIVQGYVLERFPALRGSDKVMVVDLYDPLHLETLELTKEQEEPARSGNLATSVRVLSDQIRRGDFFICASERQRDLWLGFLASAGRLNPATYRADSTLRALIDTVPFGLPDEPPVHTSNAIKGVVPGISVADEVVLWGGGVYDWLDPVTLIRAAEMLHTRRPSLRVYFLGTRHPNPVVEESKRLVEARDLAEKAGLTDKVVFFNEGWVRYEDRQNHLLEADVGVSLHFQHAETAYSFRTRLLDYLWAGLPVVATTGDGFAEIVEREDLGMTVPACEPGAVANALTDLLDDDAGREPRRERALAFGARFRWSNALAPLVAFCRDPRRAADLPTWTAPSSDPAGPSESDIHRAAKLLLHGELQPVLSASGRRLRQLARRVLRPDGSPR